MQAFISYSHRDEEALDRLHTHLSVLQREGAITTWIDREILAGAELDASISAALESSQLFLILVSPDFLASDYCYEREMTRALERHDEGEARVVPIIVEPCDWKNSPLKKLKAIPKDGKPISEWTNENAAYLNIVTELRRLLTSPSVPRASNASVEAEPARRYRAKQDFDEIDRADFRDRSFAIIRSHFENSIAEINTVDNFRGRFRDLGPTSFTCTVINRLKDRGIAYITVHCVSSNHGFGDISYSYAENASASTANGWLQVDCDEYDLYLRTNSFHGLGQDEARVSQQSAAELLWKDFIERAGITYE
ncbi:MAG: toll/interleukin-1 receptor domain-containing protein [Woeseia sp.]